MDDGSRAPQAPRRPFLRPGGCGGLEGRPLVVVGTPLAGVLVGALVPRWKALVGALEGVGTLMLRPF
jgi:hypothetical protein